MTTDQMQVLQFKDLSPEDQREVLRWCDPVTPPFSHNPIHVGYDRDGDPIWQDQPVIRDIL